MDKKIIMDGLTFDDVLVVPQKSSVLPSSVNLNTILTKKIKLAIPFLSSAMDTVTESKMAIVLSLCGGIGIIHKNMPIKEQVREVEKVKNYKTHQFQKELKDTENENYFTPSFDENGRLLVGAAIGIGDDMKERVLSLKNAGVDAIVLDSAHGHSIYIGQALAKIKSSYPELQVIAGNIATAKAAEYLIKNGADAVKVGIGPGSICTTRIIAGIGIPQITAILEVSNICKTHNIPVIADGGVRYSGDVTKAIVAGADSVMFGSLFAGSDESPGEIVEIEGQKFKAYRGMGSCEAMKCGSKDRYFQKGKKLVPEGIEGSVKYKGSVSEIVFNLAGGLRSGMGYCGASSIKELKNAKFVRISANSLAESHPHDILNIKSQANYEV